MPPLSKPLNWSDISQSTNYERRRFPNGTTITSYGRPIATLDTRSYPDFIHDFPQAELPVTGQAPSWGTHWIPVSSTVFQQQSKWVRTCLELGYVIVLHTKHRLDRKNSGAYAMLRPVTAPPAPQSF